MNMTDPVADMITRIRNGVRAKLARVDVPHSKLKVEIARILKDEGYVSNYKLVEDGRQGMLRVYLKYGPGMERVITDLQRVSRPGCRIYCGKDKIPRVYRSEERRVGKECRCRGRPYAGRKKAIE